jgi:hypothetical protein
LRATDITATSVTLSAQICITFPEVAGKEATTGTPVTGIFEYGARSGVNTQQIPVTITPKSTESPITGASDTFATLCSGDSIHPTDLEPCTDYYATFRYVFTPSEPGCPVLSYFKRITFTTLGCFARAAGGGNSGTNPSLSLVQSGPVQMSNVTVQTAGVVTTKVSPGQAVDVTATVVNKGTVNGDTRVTLYVNGEAVESRGVAVASGQTAPVNFQVSRNEPGTYSVYVNGVSAGNFTVDVFTGNDVLIYGLIALATLGIAGTLYMVARKRSA